MTAPVTSLQTPAEAALASQFAEIAAHAGASRAVRERAFARFASTGLPNRRLESWHYTDLRAALREALPPAPGGVAIEAPAGVHVRALTGGFAAFDDATRAAIYPGLGADDPAVALNAAMAQSGFLVEVEARADIAAPICIRYAGASDQRAAYYARTVVRVGAGASVRLIETCAEAPQAQRHSALVIHVDEGAQVEHVLECESADASVHVASLIVDLGQGAQFTSTALVADASWLRRQIFARLNGENAKIAFRGVSLLGGDSHADTTLVVDHAAPHGESRELFKHIVRDRGTGVFQGKVIVEPGAQKVDGAMKSQALLLSDDAAMYNKPELEIFADDVACGHGATIGQIEPDQLFYLMARGLPRREAEAMLLEGFAREVIEFVSDASLRERLEATLSRWLRTP